MRPVTAFAEPHRVEHLKITILSTMMTQVGVGEWGFAALVEADGHRILFDTGNRPDTVLLNAKTMGIDLSNVHEVVLSHNHGDHTGGLVKLREAMAKANERALSIAHVAEGILWERPGSSPERSMATRKLAYEAAGGTFIEHEQAVEIHPGIWLTGQVPRIHPEQNYGSWAGDTHRIGKLQSPEGLIDDTVPESMSMVINTSKGLVVISGCGHAGLINTLEHAVDFTGANDIHAALGGFHLFQASDTTLEWTSTQLARLGVDNLVGAHCTGLEPVYRFRELADFDRSTAVVGATGASFTLEEGIRPLSLAH
jgi:7,8-dihydropterin-6-yl-methyl-4-(beta-D-ribofuranosyl)aminobenzene 5'-phosphate synthase